MSTITTATPIAALMDVDSYKLDHRRMYGKGVTRVYSNWTNRSSRIEGVDHVVHFGLQAFLQSYCIDKFAPFFAADEDDVARLYKEDVESVVGPNAIGEDHIRALHRLGYLPLKFSAVPEGTLVPIGVPTFTIENTVDEFFWLVNYIETALSSSYWLPSTSATQALRYRGLLEDAARKTGETSPPSTTSSTTSRSAASRRRRVPPHPAPVTCSASRAATASEPSTTCAASTRATTASCSSRSRPPSTRS
ncbi:hypothetical protein GCM10025867_48430 (plasmid) [Frondihabitans sucicola]|uniref:Nicotinamide phosphoribosyltransferase N-terminal domain-containing protein n=1 Tax=Frondihabitans sucicola TaxID=1268041 RepID=A0ABM8GVV2_9MICO|nr:hypothetical protein GCM10025867_48430 [Frondihabitans sucicola]